jgi:iron complex outermembrane recepter protein
MLKGRNLSNEDVREHTSFLKDKLPKPGRSVRLSLRAAF